MVVVLIERQLVQGQHQLRVLTGLVPQSHDVYQLVAAGEIFDCEKQDGLDEEEHDARDADQLSDPDGTDEEVEGRQQVRAVFSKVLPAEKVDCHEGQALREDPGEDLPLRIRVVLPEAAGAEPADVELR